VTTSLRHPLLAAPIAIAALLLAAPLSSAAKPRVAHAGHRPAIVHTGLAGARSLGKRNRCTARISRLRARPLPTRRRRRIVRRLRGTCQATPSSAPHAPLYWGATIGEQLTGEQAPWDMGAVSKFEGLAGKGLSLVNFFAPFANCSSSPCSFYKFPTEPMESIRERGAIPVYSWSSQSIPSSLEEPDFQLGDVIGGAFDSYIREFAEDAKEWGHPFFLRFDWEMNGNWFPWSEGVNGNQPGEFVAAWRHVHDIFAEVGATNATWVWCPNVDPEEKMLSLASQYPGDEYVDWTGLDGYNWGPSKGGWASFNSLYSATYTAIAGSIAPSKPMLIGEMGSTERGGSKAEWISEALSSILASYPQIRGMLWFDTFDDGMDWPIETSAASTSAFASAVQNPDFVEGAYGNLPGGPIAPPV